MAFSYSSSPVEIVLPVRVETVLDKIYKKHNQSPITMETRKRLSEELALETLSKVHNAYHVKGTIDGFISFLLGKSVTVNSSPRLSPASLRYSLLVLRGKKVAGFSRKSLVGVITADEIRQWKNLHMVAYETTVWDRLGRLYCSQTDRRVKWRETLLLRCTNCFILHASVLSRLNGIVGILITINVMLLPMGPLMEKTGTHLHKVLGDENVLTVKFAHVSREENHCIDPYPAYKWIARNGIMVGLRRYQFFDSIASNDMQNPYIFSGKSIHKIRMHLMNVHTLPSLARYMARFSLILSKTKTLEVDRSGFTLEQIDDIHCHDQYGNDVLDKSGKPCIHSDGTGYISEDLARLCPVNVYKGKCLRSDNIQPLLIQFRMFIDGAAVKGTFLLNKKVYEDLTLSNFSTFNSIEVVTTSNLPRKAKLSRNLIALLSYGGVPNEFFLDIFAQHVGRDEDPASRNYWKMDDNMAAEMVMALIPLDEPYLKDHLSILLNTEKNNLKAGKLPVSESYYLMGTVDPTGELKENEVCVILESGQISGIYRNTGLHFGDIHVLKATYVKALEDYVGNSKYGVFFPQKGPRSLGDEIAGGDFDGDMYFISRNLKLLEHFKPSEPWVSSSPIYTGTKPSDFPPEELEAELFKIFLKTRFDPRISYCREKPPQSEIKKLPCFEVETFPESHMKRCGLWYQKYREEMNQALKHTDENIKKKSANEVNQRFKQDFYGAACLEESKRSLEELYSEALALYNVSYDYAIKWNNIRNCGFVWKIAC
ncbi:unnamed protein product [Arabis nemorensis]|uniref:RNA-dependent RNA polymerase n=1 Tax=Arabis nemorensis TaxID=586526 RepID=A0A565BEF2_9BRAS|nr:unnamed protein product [Arabis nemorensis]